MSPKVGMCSTDQLCDIFCSISLSLDDIIHLCFVLHLSSLFLMIITSFSFPAERSNNDNNRGKKQTITQEKTALSEVSSTLLRPESQNISFQYK